jgi:hypothetical protein
LRRLAPLPGATLVLDYNAACGVVDEFIEALPADYD